MDIFGPPNFAEWHGCHKVFTILAIIQQVIKGGWLRAYGTNIEKLNNQYPEAWGIIYQAEQRTRDELAPALRAQMA